MTTKKYGSKRRNEAMAEPQYLDIQTLMTRWGCCYSYVWQRLRTGELDGVRMGRAWRIPMDSVLKAEATTALGRSRESPTPTPTAAAEPISLENALRALHERIDDVARAVDEVNARLWSVINAQGDCR